MSEPTRPTCRWSSSRGRWETELWPGVSKEACGHNGHAPAIAERALTPDHEPADQTRADVVLTEAEREALIAAVLGSLPCTETEAVVEGIVADHLAAERAEHAAEMEALRREVGRTQAFNLRTEEDKGRHWRTLRDRCVAAEATVARVRAVADEWEPKSHFPGRPTSWLAVHAELDAALDGER